MASCSDKWPKEWWCISQGVLVRHSVTAPWPAWPMRDLLVISKVRSIDLDCLWCLWLFQICSTNMFFLSHLFAVWPFFKSSWLATPFLGHFTLLPCKCVRAGPGKFDVSRVQESNAWGDSNSWKHWLGRTPSVVTGCESSSSEPIHDFTRQRSSNQCICCISCWINAKLSQGEAVRRNSSEALVGGGSSIYLMNDDECMPWVEMLK